MHPVGCGVETPRYTHLQLRPVDYAGRGCLSLATLTWWESTLHFDCLANLFCHFAIREIS